MPHNMMVAAGQITVNLARSVRARHDLEKPQEYAEAMKAGAEFPRLDVFKKPDTSPAEYILTDGDKRLQAYVLNKITEIPVTLHEGTPDDARLFAARANATHGEPRSPADKRKAVRLLLEQPEWFKRSDRVVAEAAMVSHHLVADVREEMAPAQNGEPTKRVNRKGKAVKVKKRRKAAPLFEFSTFTKQVGDVLKGIDDIATAYPEEKKGGDYRLVKQAADNLFERYQAWAKRLVKAKPVLAGA